MKYFTVLFLFIFVSITLNGQNDDWTSYGKDSGGGHYSKANEITPENVKKLKKIWEHRSGDYHDGLNWTEDVIPNSSQQTSFQATPILVNDTLYYCTPYNRVFALDSETGEEKWVFDPKINIEEKALLHCRGVGSWIDKDKTESEECYHRIITGTIDADLYAIDGTTGKLCSDFGDNGSVDLRAGLGTHDPAYYYSISPPAIIGNLIIIGGGVADNVSTSVPGGVVRAYDVVTGELVWYWDPIPPNQQPIIDEDGNQLYQRGTTNVWSIISTDPELNLVYLPTGNTAADNYGGHRDGLDYYSSSVVALNATTGDVVWHFQTVHHDIWDYDVPSQPTLIDLPNEHGEKVKAVLQPTKRGEVFVLNRETGEPLFDIQELPVPQTGGVPEDYVASTQPFTTDLPVWRMQLDETKMWGLTPLDQLWCRIEYRKMRYEGHFTVPGIGTILQNPGATGGFNWGSVSVDEVNNLMVVNPLYMANQLTLIPRDQLPEGMVGSQLGTPYSHNTQRFMSPLHVPCMQPPYGTLGVVDLETKELLWQKPIGTAKHTGPTFFGTLNLPTRLPLTVGTPQTGGTVTTAGGIIFSAGAFDNTVRATNLMNGEELWNHAIPFTAQGTPMTYLSPQGNQTLIVVVPVFNSTRGSGYLPLPAEEEDPLGGYIFAFRLPAS